MIDVFYTHVNMDIKDACENTQIKGIWKHSHLGKAGICRKQINPEQ